MTRGAPKTPQRTAPTIEQTFAGAGFADVPASRLQLGICRGSEGQTIDEDLLTDEEVEAHFGCGRSRIGLVMPALVVLVCGVRAGKSFLAVCGATRDVLAADCSALKPHEISRHPIVAPTTDNANATFRLLVGVWRSSPILASMIIAETGDTLTIRRPDGRVFEIVVVAASKGAVHFRSRWLAGFTLEEAAGFGVESMGAVVNGEELLRTGMTRLLPKTQGRIISSPYGQQGILWRLFQEHFGKPGRVLVVHAPTRAMNPSFPQETIDDIRARDPDAAAREYDAAWVDPESAYFDTATLRKARRESPLERPALLDAQYVAAWDAATRGNGWTLAIGRRVDDVRIEVTLVREWRGSKTAPLSPKVVIAEIAAVLKPYRVKYVHVDQWSVDALRDTAYDAGLQLGETNTADRDESYKVLHTGLANEHVELPPHDVLEQDLRGVRKRVTPSGVRIELGRTPDGRHSDYAPSTALVVLAAHRMPIPGAGPGCSTVPDDNDRWGGERGGRGFG